MRFVRVRRPVGVDAPQQVVGLLGLDGVLALVAEAQQALAMLSEGVRAVRHARP
ncbi:MAG: hypothetical protein KatS3mg131_3643 [Candidatus Tectimicrobiota bacterium]|nr:MAG: hypothetical protein KatS3mg131_3643 [Candidatus Tectomicrobia bacterium]